MDIFIIISIIVLGKLILFYFHSLILFLLLMCIADNIKWRECVENSRVKLSVQDRSLLSIMMTYISLILAINVNKAPSLQSPKMSGHSIGETRGFLFRMKLRKTALNCAYNSSTMCRRNGKQFHMIRIVPVYPAIKTKISKID